MLAVNIIAITGTVLGIGGIAGAIEHGTSPMAAVVCLMVGVACMAISYKKGGLRSEETNDSPVAYGLHGSKHSITGSGK